MPKLDITVPFTIPKVEARQRVDQLLATLAMDGTVGNGSWSWNGDSAAVSFTMHGFTFTGVILVNDTFVDVTSQLPIIALPFRSQIESKIRLRLERVLS
jgi:hypothetical protein